MKLEFCTDDMFRVRHSQGTVFAENEQWMVRKYDFSSVNYTVEDRGTAWLITTRKLIIEATKNPFCLSVSDKNGKMLYTELEEQRFYKDSVKMKAVLQPDEHFFGFGERMDFMDQRGRKIYLNVELGRGIKPAVGGKDILRANYCPVPFMMSTKGYGLFFHTPFATEWNMGWDSSDYYSFKAFGGDLDYYFMYGPDFYTMIVPIYGIDWKIPYASSFCNGVACWYLFRWNLEE